MGGKVKNLLTITLPLFFLLGCGGGGSSHSQTVQSGTKIPTSDGQTVSVSGDNNNVQAIVADDGSTVVYCEAGATCNITINTESNGSGYTEDMEEDLNEDL
jgi:hypothetical protein